MRRVVGLFFQFCVVVLLLVLGGMTQQRYNWISKIPYISGNQNRTALSKSATKYTTTAPSRVNLGEFWEVWAQVEKDYLETDKVVDQNMVDGAISGMVASLGDPYTMYLPPKENERSGEDLAGSFFGVGIELGYIDQTLAVVAPLPGSPADKAGIKAGDLILKVKDEAKKLDEDTSGWSLNQAVDNIRGPKGTQVTLTLFRPNDKAKTETFEVNLIRDEVVVKSVELNIEKVGNKRIADLKLIRFGGRTDSEWNNAVNQIIQEKDNLDGIVLDLRNNPGGYFDGAIEVASEFVPSGVIVTEKGKTTSQDFSANGRARLQGLPLVVLVNKGSASASEIVAGALRDRLKTKLVGEKTFGKGTVQDRRELSNGGGLHVTIARWLLPSGEWIHHEGLNVDVEAKDDPNTKPDEALIKAVEVLPARSN